MRIKKDPSIEFYRDMEKVIDKHCKFIHSPVIVTLLSTIATRIGMHCSKNKEDEVFDVIQSAFEITVHQIKNPQA